MASEWAKKFMQKNGVSALRNGEIIRCVITEEALDAAGEEVAMVTLRVDHFYRYGVQPPDVPSHRDNEVVKRVLDKRGR